MKNMPLDKNKKKIRTVETKWTDIDLIYFELCCS